MKKLFILLFLILISFSSLSDDISDFEIEGISIGDSLLEYMSKGEILKEIERNKNDYHYFNMNDPYFMLYLFEEFPIYDLISVVIKNNALSKYVTNSNEEYKVLGIIGTIYYNEDYDNCIINRDEVVEELSNIYKNSNQEIIEEQIGNVLSIDGVYFSLVGGGLSEASCFKNEKNFKQEYNYKDFLEVRIYSPEIISWFGIRRGELSEKREMAWGNQMVCGTEMIRRSSSTYKKDEFRLSTYKKDEFSGDCPD